MDKCPVEQDYRKYDEGKLFKLNVHFFHGPSAFVRTRFIISFGPDLAPPRANEAEGYPDAEKSALATLQHRPSERGALYGYDTKTSST